MPPLRPSAEVMRLRATLGSAPASLALRTHMTDRVPGVRLAEADPTVTVAVAGVGTAEAVCSGASPHAYVNQDWITAHHVPIQMDPVAKVLLRTATAMPDTDATFYRVVGSVPLWVRLPQPVRLRLSERAAPTAITFFVFEPLGPVCAEMILAGLGGSARVPPAASGELALPSPDRPLPRRPVNDRLRTLPGVTSGSDNASGARSQPLRALSLPPDVPPPSGSSLRRTGQNDPGGTDPRTAALCPRVSHVNETTQQCSRVPVSASDPHSTPITLVARTIAVPAAPEDGCEPEVPASILGVLLPPEFQI